MFNKEIIDEKCEQVINIINNFLIVLPDNGDVHILLGTNNNDNGISLCSLLITTKSYKFSKNFPISRDVRRLLYDKITNTLFSKYVDNDNISISKNIDGNLYDGNSWQIIMNDSIKNNRVVLEYSIETNKDFLWISSVFEKFDQIVKTDKQKSMKIIK